MQLQIFGFSVHNTALKSENHATHVRENQFELAIFLSSMLKLLINVAMKYWERYL
jgi:hypothetical protein